MPERLGQVPESPAEPDGVVPGHRAQTVLEIRGALARRSSAVLALQRTAGNRVTGRLLARDANDEDAAKIAAQQTATAGAVAQYGTWTIQQPVTDVNGKQLGTLTVSSNATAPNNNSHFGGGGMFSLDYNGGDATPGGDWLQFVGNYMYGTVAGQDVYAEGPTTGQNPYLVPWSRPGAVTPQGQVQGPTYSIDWTRSHPVHGGVARDSPSLFRIYSSHYPRFGIE